MKAPKKIQKPENWQDFETLCRKLWWEIWQCSEIKKHWRQWQNQSWVDVYWVPKWEDSYFWIQCKWKDDYTNATLTEKEIETEIQKAKKFKPKLKKFYFATTANKNVSIEEFIREKNLENKKDFFEVHIFMWEDIAELIDENQNTHRFYVESMNYKQDTEVELVFSNGFNTINEEAFFSMTTTKYIYREPRKELYTPYWNPNIANMLKSIQASHPLLWTWEYKWENMSWINIWLILNNKGSKQLENYKVYLKFSWDIEYLDEKDGMNYIVLKPENRTVFLWDDSKSWTLRPIWDKPLVPNDSYIFSNIDIKPKPVNGVIFIDWELVSTHYTKKWQLEIKIESHIVDEEVIEYVDNKEEEKEEKVLENFYYKSDDDLKE